MHDLRAVVGPRANGGFDCAAYEETDSSLYDSDKKRLWGSDHYRSDRAVVKPSPWAEGDFEEKMAMLLRWANALNHSDPAFAKAQSLLSHGSRQVCRCEQTGAPNGA